MSEFKDRFGRYHDEPCWDGEPSSNNGWIFTAYAKKVGLPVESIKLENASVTCMYFRKRHPYEREAPPMSRDEILGLCYLYPFLGKYLGGWWMCYNPPIFNVVRFIKQLILLFKNRHERNYWWKNDLDQMQYLTMKVPVQDRAFILRLAGKKPNLFYRLVEQIDKRLKPSSRSSKAIRHLKYDQGEGIYEYFTYPNHPISKR